MPTLTSRSAVETRPSAYAEGPAGGSLCPVSWAVYLLAAIKFAVTIAFAGRYGFHRDELYYIASGQHPSLGYVDYPPISPMLARLDTIVFGAGLTTLRLLPILAGTTIVILGGGFAGLAAAQQPEIATTVAFTEGPAVDRDGNVYFTEMVFQRIMKLTPSGVLSTYRERSNNANGLLVDPQGRLVACEGAEFSLGGAARERARAYSWDDIGRRLLAIYEHVAGKEPAALAAAG